MTSFNVGDVVIVKPKGEYYITASGSIGVVSKIWAPDYSVAVEWLRLTGAVRELTRGDRNPDGTTTFVVTPSDLDYAPDTVDGMPLADWVALTKIKHLMTQPFFSAGVSP